MCNCMPFDPSMNVFSTGRFGAMPAIAAAAAQPAQSLYHFPGWVQLPKTKLEQRIDALTSALRAKPDWQRKCQDEAIVARWKSEALEQGLSEEMFSFALQVHISCSTYMHTHANCIDSTEPPSMDSLAPWAHPMSIHTCMQLLF